MIRWRLVLWFLLALAAAMAAMIVSERGPAEGCPWDPDCAVEYQP